MKRDPIKANVLASIIIPNVSPDLAKQLNLAPDQKSLALRNVMMNFQERGKRRPCPERGRRLLRGTQRQST